MCMGSGSSRGLAVDRRELKNNLTLVQKNEMRKQVLIWKKTQKTFFSKARIPVQVLACLSPLTYLKILAKERWKVVSSWKVVIKYYSTFFFLMASDSPQSQNPLSWPNLRNSGLVKQKDFCCRKILVLLRKVRVLQQERTNLMEEEGIYCKWDALPDGVHESFCTRQASSLWGVADQKSSVEWWGSSLCCMQIENFPKRNK